MYTKSMVDLCTTVTYLLVYRTVILVQKNNYTLYMYTIMKALVGSLTVIYNDDHSCSVP